MADNLSDLLARVREAEGPSRELDALLEIALDIRPDYVGAPGHRRVIVGEDGDPLIHWTGVYGTLRATNWTPGQYTASLDAIIAQIERRFPGIWWFIAKGKTRADEPLYGAQLMFGQEVVSQAEHDDLCLAACAALLAAIVAEGEG